MPEPAVRGCGRSVSTGDVCNAVVCVVMCACLYVCVCVCDDEEKDNDDDDDDDDEEEEEEDEDEDEDDGGNDNNNDINENIIDINEDIIDDNIDVNEDIIDDNDDSDDDADLDKRAQGSRHRNKDHIEPNPDEQRLIETVLAYAILDGLGHDAELFVGNAGARHVDHKRDGGGEQPDGQHDGPSRELETDALANAKARTCADTPVGCAFGDGILNVFVVEALRSQPSECARMHARARRRPARRSYLDVRILGSTSHTGCCCCRRRRGRLLLLLLLLLTTTTTTTTTTIKMSARTESRVTAARTSLLREDVVVVRRCWCWCWCWWCACSSGVEADAGDAAGLRRTDPAARDMLLAAGDDMVCGVASR
jgi:hypothetical protein